MGGRGSDRQRPSSRVSRDATRGRRSGSPAESLVAVHDEARRERLLDMELRVRRYRTACFAILAVALAAARARSRLVVGAPLALGFCRVRRRRSLHAHQPASGRLGRRRLGSAARAARRRSAPHRGPTSPALVWFALPAVTLGARFEPRGMVIGTVYILTLVLISAVAVDPASAVSHSQSLIAAVALILSTVILSGALVESDRAHRRRSTLDPLTGLFNRNALEQRLAELDGQPSNQEKGLSHALLLCDLDHFKRVNDQLGHAAGDAVLQEVAYTMRASLRTGDSIYRVGGEEILVVLPGASKKDAGAVAERLRQAVHERRPAGVGVTISIGVAVSETKTVDTEDLVARADAALYAAKASGRDTVYVDN